MLKNLGNRIRSLRKEKSLTLIDIAEKTGIAQATLSRIETGVMIGTLESHEKIAEILGIGLAELYTGIDGRYEQISHVKAQDQKATFHSKSADIKLLTQESSKKKITPLLITLEGQSHLQKESAERGVEKFLFVLDGEIRAKIDEQEFQLKTGETLYFDASLPHQFTNDKQKSARFLICISPSKI